MNEERDAAAARCGEFGAEDGMTLAEVMIVIVLVMIISGGLLGLLIDSGRLYSISQAFSDNQDSSRIAMDRMTKDIRQGERWVMTEAYEIRFRQYIDGERKVKYIGYRLADKSAMADDPGYDTIERYVDNDVFDAVVGTYTPVANFIQNKRLGHNLFEYHLPESVGISLWVDNDTTQKPSVSHLNTSIEPRNQNKQEW